MITIEQASNGYIIKAIYPTATPEKLHVFKSFPEAVNHLAWLCGYRAIGEKVDVSIKQENDH